MGISELPLRRREVTRLATLAAAAVAGVGVATAGVSLTGASTAGASTAGASIADASIADASIAGRRRRLRARPDGVDALELAVDSVADTARRGDGLRTKVVPTTRYTAFGVTWGRGDGRVRARWRRETGGWTEWSTLPRLAHGPDAGSAEAASARPATDLVWTGPSNAVQLELTGDQRDAVLVLLRPRRRPGDALAGRRGPGTADVDAAGRDGTGAVPMPGLLYRKDWSPDPRLRNGRPSYNRRIRQVHVHHTVSSNDYAWADVPGMIRAMYRYHTHNLGWSDIGYNFLVDRFGRLWEGRAGGPRRAVRGAHTLGFNHASVGVAVIGNLESGRVRKPMIRALVRLAAWKLDEGDGHPRRTVWVRSTGSDRFPDGELVELPTIDGHRDTNETACPGERLYDVLPAVRRRTARRMREFRGH